MSPSYSSDPEILGTRARTDAQWREQSPVHVPNGANYIAPEEISNTANPVAAQEKRWRSGFIAAALIVCAFVYYTFSGGTVQEMADGSAANWNLQIASGSHKPVKMLAYGKNAGLHLVTVEPAREGHSHDTQLPARLGEGQVWMFALSFSPIEVHATAPANTGGAKAFSASGHVIKAFQNGVKVW